MTAPLPPRAAIDGHPIMARRLYLAAIQFVFPEFYHRLMAALWDWVIKEHQGLQLDAFRRMLLGFFEQHGITEGWLKVACSQTVARYLEQMEPMLSTRVVVIDERPVLREGQTWWAYAEGFDWETFRPTFKSRPSFHPVFTQPYLLHETYGEIPEEKGTKDTPILRFRRAIKDEYGQQRYAEILKCASEEREVLGPRLDDELDIQLDEYVDRMAYSFLETREMPRDALLAVLKRFGADGNGMKDIDVLKYMVERFAECRGLGLEAMVKGRSRFEARLRGKKI